jgi:hypothetical protein
MVITIGPDLESTLNDLAHKQGVAPEVLALDALRERFLAATPLQARDDWEKQVLGLAKDCGESLPVWAVSRQPIYE